MDEALATRSAMGAGVATSVVSPVGAPGLYWYPSANACTAYPREPGAGAPRTVETPERNIPENTVPLKEGAKVAAADGESLRHVERMFVNSETKRATHVLLETGKLSKSHKTIPIQWVETVNEGEVRLAVRANLLEGLPEYKN